MNPELKSSEKEVFNAWLRQWVRDRFGKWITHNTANGAYLDFEDERNRRAALSPSPVTQTPVNIGTEIGEFKPCVVHYEDGDFSQMLLEDCATITGWPHVLVEPLYRMNSNAEREIVGFQWDGKSPPEYRASPVTQAGEAASQKVEAALMTARLFAEDAIAQNVQWRLDPNYIITICDEVARLRSAAVPPSDRAEVARLREALDTIATSFHGSNPSLAYADVPREDYLEHVLMEARRFARAALSEREV